MLHSHMFAACKCLEVDISTDEALFRLMIQLGM